MPLAKVQLLQEYRDSPGGKVQAGNWLIVKDSKRNKNGESTGKHALSWTTHSPLSLQLIKGKVTEGLDHSLWWHRSQKVNTMGHFLLRDKVVTRPSAGSWSQRKHNLGGELIYHWNYLLKGSWCFLQHRKTQVLQLVCILKDTKYLKRDKCTQRLLVCFSPFSMGDDSSLLIFFFWSLPHDSYIISARIFSSSFSIFLTTFSPKSCKTYLFSCCHIDYHVFHMPAALMLRDRFHLFLFVRINGEKWLICYITTF